MNATRTLERMIFNCPELSCSDCQRFPVLQKEALQAMETEFNEDTSAIHIFPYLKKNTDEVQYIDIYIWDQMLYPATYERFIICEGFRMREEDEERFLGYISGSLLESQDNVEQYNREEQFIRQTASAFPQWHLSQYAPNQIGTALEHMYFASHRSGAREILYKAGLTNIARNLDRLPDYNLIGSNPEKIIGHELSIKLLRMIDHSDYIYALFDVESMKRYREVFKRYSGYMGQKPPSKCQWKYLEELSASDGVFAGETFNRELYNNLEDCHSVFILAAYKRFLELRSEYANVRKLKLPKPEEIGNLVDKLEKVHKYQMSSVVDDSFAFRSSKDVYSYAGTDYSVIMPRRAFDICMEAVQQRNCAMDYIDAHASGSSTILFVRKTMQPDRSFVTMEIKDNCIKQVYGRFNQLPEKDVYVFLEEYSRKAWLTYNPYELIMQSIDEEDGCTISDDLWDYAEAYKKRSSYAPVLVCNDGKYVQLSMKELFPELFQEPYITRDIRTPDEASWKEG